MILEFIIAFKSFSLIAELIVVPLSTLAVMMLAFSELKEEYQSVEKMMSWLLSIFVICMVAFGIYSMASNFGEFAQSKTLMDFYTPMILSILLLPFIFIVSVYMVYERIFSKINACTENHFYRNYAKLKGLLCFKRDPKSLNNWVSFMCVSDFESRKTIDESINRYKESQEKMV